MKLIAVVVVLFTVSVQSAQDCNKGILEQNLEEATKEHVWDVINEGIRSVLSLNETADVFKFLMTQCGYAHAQKIVGNLITDSSRPGLAESSNQGLRKELKLLDRCLNKAIETFAEAEDQSQCPASSLSSEQKNYESGVACKCVCPDRNRAMDTFHKAVTAKELKPTSNCPCPSVAHETTYLQIFYNDLDGETLRSVIDLATVAYEKFTPELEVVASSLKKGVAGLHSGIWQCIVTLDDNFASNTDSINAIRFSIKQQYKDAVNFLLFKTCKEQ